MDNLDECFCCWLDINRRMREARNAILYDTETGLLRRAPVTAEEADEFSRLNKASKAALRAYLKLLAGTPRVQQAER